MNHIFEYMDTEREKRKFIPGLKLSERYYSEIVQPIIESEYSDMPHAAALLGQGSEVLGFDTEISADHDWGPRLFLFLSRRDYEQFGQKLAATIDERLPEEFLGFSTRFAMKDGIIRPQILISTVNEFIEKRLAFNPEQEPGNLDWLTFPEQRLLEITSGAVFHDDAQELTKMRKKFAYYPEDVWKYLLSAQWTRIAQEEAFVGRTVDVGDELGSQMIAGRISRDLIKLAFLMERQYMPYSKWLGTAFTKLESSARLTLILREVLRADSFLERERALTSAYEMMAKRHNDLGITEPLATKVSNYYDRPYQVIHSGRFADAIRQSIKDTQLKQLKTNIGSVNQFTDSTDITEHPELTRKMKILYEES